MHLVKFSRETIATRWFAFFHCLISLHCRHSFLVSSPSQGSRCCSSSLINFSSTLSKNLSETVSWVKPISVRTRRLWFLEKRFYWGLFLHCIFWVLSIILFLSKWHFSMPRKYFVFFSPSLYHLIFHLKIAPFVWYSMMFPNWFPLVFNSSEVSFSHSFPSFSSRRLISPGSAPGSLIFLWSLWKKQVANL